MEPRLSPLIADWSPADSTRDHDKPSLFRRVRSVDWMGIGGAGGEVLSAVAALAAALLILLLMSALIVSISNLFPALIVGGLFFGNRGFKSRRASVDWPSRFTGPFARIRSSIAPPPTLFDEEVEARFLVDGLEYGRDVGRLQIVDGWLVFDGVKTMFSLMQSDLDRRLTVVGMDARLVLGGLSGEISIHLKQHHCDPRLIYVDVHDWYQKGERPQGASLLPPLLPKGQLVVDWRIRWLVPALFGAAVGVWLAIPLFSASAPAIFASAAIGIVAAKSIEDVTHAIRSRRALRRLDLAYRRFALDGDRESVDETPKRCANIGAPADEAGHLL